MTGYFKFIGKDSLGYKHGEKYALKVTEPSTIRKFFRGWPSGWRVIIEAPNFCPYASWYSFYKNWEEV